MSTLSLQGILIKKNSIENIENKEGKKWKKQTFVIQTNAEYNNQICFQLFGEEKITILENHKEGDKIEVFFNISSKEYNNRYYHNIDAWRINPINNDEKEDQVKKSLIFLKNKAKTLEDIFNNSKYLLSEKVQFNNEDLKLIDDTSKKIIAEFTNRIKNLSKFDRENLEPLVNELIKSNNTNFKGVGQPLRIALTGSKYGPGIYDIIVSLGKDEVLKRLGNKIFI